MQGTFLGIDDGQNVADAVEDERRLGKQTKDVTDNGSGKLERVVVGSFDFQAEEKFSWRCREKSVEADKVDGLDAKKQKS